MDSLKKSFLIIILIIGIIAISISFSTLSTRLSVSGTASVSDTTWNIHFQNWALDTESTITEGGVTHQNTADYPSISTLSNSMSLKPNVTKVENLNVTLYQPGDYVKYTFEIINEGSIDASLDNFTKTLTCSSGSDCSHISYIVECTDSASEGGNNVLVGNSTLSKNGGLAYCYLEIKYIDQTNTQIPGENQVYTKPAVSATLNAEWTYVQKITENSANSGEQGQGGSSSSNEGENSEINNDNISRVDYKYHYGNFDYDENYDAVPLFQDNFDNEISIWIQEDKLTSVRDLCVKFSGGEVCFNKDSYDYVSVNSILNPEGQKSLSLIQKFNAAGATNCTTSESDIMCSDGNIKCDASYDVVGCFNLTDYSSCSMDHSGSPIGCYYN